MKEVASVPSYVGDDVGVESFAHTTGWWLPMLQLFMRNGKLR